MRTPNNTQEGAAIMERMNQGDVFQCIHDLLGAKYRAMAYELSDIADSEQDYSSLNKIANQKRPGSELFKHKAREIFEAFFVRRLDQKETLDDLRVRVREWLEDKSLMFTGMDDPKYSAPDAWLMQMLKRSLQNCSKCRDPERRSTSRSGTPSLTSHNFANTKAFVGREDQLGQIRSILHDAHVIVLRGGSGIGKTCLARQYAASESYSCIQETVADDSNPSSMIRRAILALSFTGLKEESFEGRLSALKAIKDEELLIIDGIETPAEDTGLIADIVKRSGLHIILTTRMTGFFEGMPSLNIPPMTAEEGFELFVQYSGRKVYSPSERAELRRILTGYCDGVPKYIEQTARYMDKWELEPSEMLEAFTDGVFGKVFTESLIGEDVAPERLEVLRALALLPPEGVSRRMFFEALTDEMRIEEVALEEKGLVLREQRDTGSRIRMDASARAEVRETRLSPEDRCGEFVAGITRIMGGSRAEEWREDLRAVVMNALEHLQAAWEEEVLNEWAEFFREDEEVSMMLKRARGGGA